MVEKTMDKIVALAKSRGFVYPGSEIYGGLANTWDYGNLGVELKNNVKKAWWKKFVQENLLTKPERMVYRGSLQLISNGSTEIIITWSDSRYLMCIDS